MDRLDLLSICNVAREIAAHSRAAESAVSPTSVSRFGASARYCSNLNPPLDADFRESEELSNL